MYSGYWKYLLAPFMICLALLFVVPAQADNWKFWEDNTQENNDMDNSTEQNHDMDNSEDVDDSDEIAYRWDRRGRGYYRGYYGPYRFYRPYRPYYYRHYYYYDPYYYNYYNPYYGPGGGIYFRFRVN